MTPRSQSPVEDDASAVLLELAHAYREMIVGFARRIGQSQGRLELLAQFRRKPQLTQVELQIALAVDPAAVTRHVRQAEKNGLVSRRIHPEDRRCSLVSLTPKGARLLDDLLRERQKFAAQVTANLAPRDRQATLRCLRLIRRNLRALKILDPEESLSS